MKKAIRFLVFLFAFSLAAVPALAAAPQPIVVSQPAAYTLTVNGSALDLSTLPRPLYKDGSTVMVSLRKTAEALGLTVTWLPSEKGMQVEDSVQSATLHSGSTAVKWTGKLKIIDLSRDTELASAAVIWSGYTYVPAEFFEEFFCTVSTAGGAVDIAPIVYTLD